jgi:hypothetical protein
LVWISYDVRLTEGGELEFKSALRTVRVRAQDLRFVRSAMSGLDPYTVIFSNRTGSDRTPRQMHGFSDLVSQLTALNPTLVLDGVCPESPITSPGSHPAAVPPPAHGLAAGRG